MCVRWMIFSFQEQKIQLQKFKPMPICFPLLCSWRLCSPEMEQVFMDSFRKFPFNMSVLPSLSPWCSPCMVKVQLLLQYDVSILMEWRCRRDERSLRVCQPVLWHFIRKKRKEKSSLRKLSQKLKRFHWLQEWHCCFFLRTVTVCTLRCMKGSTLPTNEVFHHLAGLGVVWAEWHICL